MLSIKQISRWVHPLSIFVLLNGLATPQEFSKPISNPSNLFNVPTADILRSAEVCISGGSSFGIENTSALVRNFTAGLGGIAEAEISTAGLPNQLTGENESFAMSSFKINLIPESLQKFRFFPNIVVQLKSSSWKNIRNEAGSIRMEYYDKMSYSGETLRSLDVEERFSLLNVIIGKRWAFGGFHAGVCGTDIRLKNGKRWYTPVDSKDWYAPVSADIPETQKKYWTPVGGIELKANDRTRILAEIQSIPVFDFDVHRQNILISKAWLGVAGIRFFVADWLTLDAGVKYQSNDKGFADAEIRLGGNCVIPVNVFLGKVKKSFKNQSEE